MSGLGSKKLGRALREGELPELLRLAINCGFPRVIVDFASRAAVKIAVITRPGAITHFLAGGRYITAMPALAPAARAQRPIGGLGTASQA